ncbi:MAG: hypothetical protein A3J68_02020 [Candidatus Wildermuthbacteria bacterium RIFCSPHIGHO2_02_FULL_48_16]|uniref:UDP-glucose/GDP-mannose dehydrogenase dimerisation domain-containing protein n=1 Tax=Candidatus Wildermuthbacteria bacterium RIFCSPHIGHO2_02_FULL_48_16 TaxID=1802453 RepID=A0A1G2R8E8_9BACT|nr:MAG: hypothetical protein A3J68_02020 [Candidatus Wildermuthbacteria bacterium RIFCSPHIGHO2_02_FULL_48_16]
MQKSRNKKPYLSNVGILGYGEVGQAIAKFFAKPKVKDLKRKDDFTGIDVLHVCIPWSKSFVDIVKGEIRAFKPKLVIVHSTVIPGTTKKIGKLAVHSPVRGVHPNLHKGIRTFVKYIGADDKKVGLLAQKHLESVGMNAKILNPSSTTELGKILDTTYYGVCIAFHKEMMRLCDAFGVDFDSVMTDFNSSYNTGYTKLGMSHVVRPVLKPEKGPIGGHCVVQNAELLDTFFKSKAVDLVLAHKQKKNHG